MPLFNQLLSYLECSIFDKLIPLIRQSIYRFVYYGSSGNQEKSNIYSDITKREFFIINIYTYEQRLKILKLLEFVYGYLNDDRINYYRKKSINVKIGQFFL